MTTLEFKRTEPHSDVLVLYTYSVSTRGVSGRERRGQSQLVLSAGTVARPVPHSAHAGPRRNPAGCACMLRNGAVTASSLAHTRPVNRDASSGSSQQLALVGTHMQLAVPPSSRMKELVHFGLLMTR